MNNYKHKATIIFNQTNSNFLSHINMHNHKNKHKHKTTIIYNQTISNCLCNINE